MSTDYAEKIAALHIPYGEGSIYVDDAGVWRASIYRDGKRRTKIAPGRGDTGMRNANALRVQMLAQADAGIVISTGKETVAQAVTAWLDVALPTEDLTAGTLRRYRTQAGHISRGLGAVKVAKLRVGHVDRFLAGLAAEGYARAQVGMVRAVLSLILADAKRRGELVAFSVEEDTLKATGTPEVERRPLSEDECARILAAARGLAYAHVFTLALDSGARRGELLGLRWIDVDEERGTIRIDQQLAEADADADEKWALTPRLKTKNSRRTSRIGAGGVAALAAQRKMQKEWQVKAKPGEWDNSDGLVFTNAAGGWIHPSALGRALRVALKRAKLDADTLGESISMHWFRHTHASHLVDNGVASRDVAAQIGDSLATVERVYYKATRPSSPDVSAALDAMWGRIAGGVS